MGPEPLRLGEMGRAAAHLSGDETVGVPGLVAGRGLTSHPSAEARTDGAPERSCWGKLNTEFSPLCNGRDDVM